jgi:hypothetical protein
MSEPDSGSDLASVRTRAHRGRRRLSRQRHEAVDLQRASSRLHDPACAHGRSGRAAHGGAHAIPRRPEGDRRHCHPPGLQPRGRAPFQRSRVPGRVPAGRLRARHGRRRLEAGDRRAGFRALGAGTLPVRFPAAGRAHARARSRAFRARRHRARPDRRPPLYPAAGCRALSPACCRRARTRRCRPRW